MMSFPQAIRTCYRKYAAFSGRAQLSEFWFFWLYYVLVLLIAFPPFVILLVLAARDSSTRYFPLFLLIGAVVWFAHTIPLLAAMSRRIQDTGATGWLVLFFPIPLGPLLILAWCCVPG
ncbi:MAG: DUF805 domain-containing protein, partial [Proteobacteria bacterium]|nr:DUF805 domain-containing protein [Pseudomonadota bacterium]